MSARSHKSRLVWMIGMCIFVGVVMLFPTQDDDPATLAQIECNASAVALHQHLFALSEQGVTVDPDALAAFTVQFDTLQDEMRGLRRRDDRHLIHVRPAIARAETARDAAVSSDANAYLEDALADLQTCHDTIFAETT